MNTNTTLKIVTLCIICAATLMGGCLTSDDTTDSAIDDAVTIDTPSEAPDEATPTTPDVVDTVISDGSSNHLTVVYIDLNQFEYSDKLKIMRTILRPDGTAELCGDTMRGDDCFECTWKQVANNEYEVFGSASDTHITLLPNAVAEVRMFGDLVYVGGWEQIDENDTNR